MRDFKEDVPSNIQQKYKNILKKKVTLQQVMDRTMIFFVRRDAVLRMKKFVVWEEMNPKDWFIVPLDEGFINNSDFQFFSHFWRTKEHPDPDAVDLKNLKEIWEKEDKLTKYIWIDFCCIPQLSRSNIEQEYCNRVLGAIPLLIQECCFSWIYEEKDDRNRVWIFYEMMVNSLLHLDKIPLTDDNKKYHDLIVEFFTLEKPLEQFLAKHKFSTASSGDLDYIIKYLSIIMKLRTLIDWMPLLHQQVGNMYVTNKSSEVSVGSLSLIPDQESCPINLEIDLRSAAVTFNGLPVNIHHKKLLSVFLGKEPVHDLSLELDVQLMYANILTAIPNVLDRAEGEALCKKIGQQVYNKWDHEGMVTVCEYIRDRLDHHNHQRYRHVERAWNGVGDWMG